MSRREQLGSIAPWYAFECPNGDRVELVSIIFDCRVLVGCLGLDGEEAI
ncbi:MAG: hypothetical protein PVH50_03705 [Anaerolineae bacterium]|jgi:hypothetical protein